MCRSRKTSEEFTRLLRDKAIDFLRRACCKLHPNHSRKRNFSLPFYKMILKADSPPPAGMPRSLEKIGDHLHKARIKRGLKQKDLAHFLGVTESCIWLWENHRSAPPIPRCKGVIEFLGYDPFPKPETFSEELVSLRRLKGLRVKDAAALAKVDPANWSSWERGEHKITGQYLARLQSLLHS